MAKRDAKKRAHGDGPYREAPLTPPPETSNTASSSSLGCTELTDAANEMREPSASMRSVIGSHSR